MITLGQLLGSSAVRNTMMYQMDETPVYVRVDGVLRTIDAVDEGQIQVEGHGAHDIVVVVAGPTTGTEVV